MRIIGIDPGAQGSIAMFDEDGELSVQKLPQSPQLMWSVLVPLEPAFCLVERVNAGPKMASRAAFKFGRGFERILMGCQAAGLTLDLVSPQVWKKEFGLIMKGGKLGEQDTEKAKRTREKASSLFPRLAIYNWNAAGVLIAEYARRQWEKENGQVTG